MGFLEPIDHKSLNHRCVLPNNVLLISGTRWQCDDCGRIYVLETLTEHDGYFKQWVREN